MSSFTSTPPSSQHQRVVRSDSCIIYPDDDQNSIGSIKINMPVDMEDYHHSGKPSSNHLHETANVNHNSTNADYDTGSHGKSTNRKENEDYYSPRDGANHNNNGDETGDDLNEVYELTSAMQEYESIGVRSKQYGYQGSRDALCSTKHMNDNYNMALHYMNRYIIQDYQITIPSVTMAVFYPNKEISSSLSTDFMRVPTTALMNALYLSLPNPTTITMNTIITHTSRNRLIVNIPTVVGRVLKGVDYQSSIPSSRSMSIHLPEGELPRSSMNSAVHGNRFGETNSGVDDVRYLCIGELVCTARIAV